MFVALGRSSSRQQRSVMILKAFGVPLQAAYGLPQTIQNLSLKCFVAGLICKSQCLVQLS